MRYSFGSDMPGWAYVLTGPVLAPATGATVTFWAAEIGGSQYTDLSLSSDGSIPVISVVTSDGSDGKAPGSLPHFWGPDGTAVMWAQVAGNARQIIVANDAPMLLAGQQTVIGLKTFGPWGDVNSSRMLIFAETNGQVADVLQAWSGADKGQGGAPQRTFYLNEKGELRVICARFDSTGVRIKGNTGQTANVLEQTDIANNAISWWAPDGSWRAPNLGQVLGFSVSGAVAVGTGAHRIYNDTGVPQIIRAVRASVATAPTGGANGIKVDVNKNGTSIFTNQANRPTIPVAQNTSGKVTNMDITALADGDFITVDVDTVGTTVAGSDLVVQVLVY